MKLVSIVKSLLCVLAVAMAMPSHVSAGTETITPPAIPLVACDPYFSIWSNTDALNEGETKHWTGRAHPITSLVTVDGKAFRLMGDKPSALDAMEQKSVEVLPTQTIYTFEGAGVCVKMTFLQAALPDDIDLMSRPVVYLTWDISSLDKESHKVSVYFDAAMDLVVNDRSQRVTWSEEKIWGMKTLKAGSLSQNILGRKGDNVRIDWGYFYLSAANNQKADMTIARPATARDSFVSGSDLPEQIAYVNECTVEDDSCPVMAMAFDRKVKASKPQSCQVILAYDDIESVLYFGQNLSAYWKRDGKTIQKIIREASKDYKSIVKRCAAFDAELIEDMQAAGGDDYVIIGNLAYRQALAANKIVADKKGMPLMFSKENFSNGCMGTVDVFYPFAPQVLLLNTTLAKASFVPILEYGRSECWKFPFAPHDIGTYPHAMGQVYGGGERTEDNQMPVEECGNMILLVGAVVQAENDIEFARQYWDVLTVWAEYLKSKGLDPENQLCTDDFAGHLAHNVNLSVKAIVALGAYAKMADMMGEDETAASFRKTAEQYTKQWMEMADDGDHYRLAFDKPGTWSQKYNLIWDRLLDLKLFPESVAKKEMAYYRKVQNEYGLPLDNRSQYTKLDWIIWTASITGSKDDFMALAAPIVKFLDETPDRVPMTDWYWTQNARHRGFQARPVVGGVFIRLMDNAKVWSKWVKNADSVDGTWAKLPKPPKIIDIVPMSIDEHYEWSYTFDAPKDDNWFAADFDPAAAGWKTGKAGFGTKGTPGAYIGTVWNTSDIWVTRKFELGKLSCRPKLIAHHDEDAEVYINGVLAAELLGFTGNGQPFELSDKAYKSLKEGTNTISIHCHQTTGGQYIDAGLVEVIPQKQDD